MKVFSGVAMTDELNLKNHIFPVKGICNSYIESPPYPTPSFANHDHTKLIGYTELSGIFCQPGKAFLLNNSFFPESKEEYDYFPDAFNYLKTKRYDEQKPKYDEFKRLLGDDLTTEAIPCWVNAVSYFDRDIVKRVLPELSSVDKDGLIDIGLLTQIMPGIYRKGSYIFFAHHYFRRGFSRLNTLSQEFLGLLFETKKETQCSVKIAIDYDMIGMLGTETNEFEYSYWWGPKFSETLQDIPYGVTKHNNDSYDSVFSSIRWTEFGFYEQDAKQTFECEEVTDAENIVKNDAIYSGCRFVHSMLNKETHLPEHLDGAIRAYSEEKMCQRLDINISESDRDAEYDKLWRIDGEISVIRWKELITHFFRDNMLIGEYFGGQDDKLVERNRIPDLPQAPVIALSNFIPVQISKGDGLRLAIKRTPIKSESNQYQVYIRSNSVVLLNDETLRYYESETITLAKLLKRKGLSIRIPNMKCLEFGDVLTNMPVFECTSTTSANIVLQSFLELCSKWDENGDNRLASITVKIKYVKWYVSFSFAGHVSDFITFFNGTIKFPEFEDVSNWVDHFHKNNTHIYGEKSNPEPFQIFHNNGVLAFKRCFVDNEYINRIQPDSKSIAVSLKLPIEEALLLSSSKIKAAPVWEIKREICSGCKANYETCDCIKFIDGVSVNVDDARPIGLIWTERHAWDGIEPLSIKK